MIGHQDAFREVKRVGEKLGITDEEIKTLLSTVPKWVEEMRPVSPEQAGKSISDVLKSLRNCEGEQK